MLQTTTRQDAARISAAGRDTLRARCVRISQRFGVAALLLLLSSIGTAQDVLPEPFAEPSAQTATDDSPLNIPATNPQPDDLQGLGDLLAGKADPTATASDNRPSLDELIANFAKIEQATLPYHIKSMETFRVPQEYIDQKHPPFPWADGRTHQREMEYRLDGPHDWLRKETELIDGVRGLTKEATGTLPDPLPMQGQIPAAYDFHRPLLGIFPIQMSFPTKDSPTLSEFHRAHPGAIQLQWEEKFARLEFSYGPETYANEFKIWLSPRLDWHPVKMQRTAPTGPLSPYFEEWEASLFVKTTAGFHVKSGSVRYRTLPTLERPSSAEDLDGPKPIPYSVDFEIHEYAYEASVDLRVPELPDPLVLQAAGDTDPLMQPAANRLNIRANPIAEQHPVLAPLLKDLRELELPQEQAALGTQVRFASIFLSDELTEEQWLPLCAALHQLDIRNWVIEMQPGIQHRVVLMPNEGARLDQLEQCQTALQGSGFAIEIPQFVLKSEGSPAGNLGTPIVARSQVVTPQQITNSPLIVEVDPTVRSALPIAPVLDLLQTRQNIEFSNGFDRMGQPVDWHAEIRAQNETEAQLVINAVEQLQQFGIRRIMFEAPRTTDRSNQIIVTYPANATATSVLTFHNKFPTIDGFEVFIRVAAEGPVTPTGPIPVELKDDVTYFDPTPEMVPGAPSTRLTLTRAPIEPIKLFRLQHVDAAEAVKILTPLWGDLDLTLVVDQRTNSILARGDAGLLNEVAGVIQILDTPTETPTNETPTNESAAPPMSPFPVPGTAGPGPGTMNPNSPRSAIPPRRPPIGMSLPELPPGTGMPANSGIQFLGPTLAVSEPAVAVLRERFRQREQQSLELAARLRRPVPSPAVGLQLQEQLRKSVQEAFVIRQQLQRAELQDLAQRVESLRQSLELRERLADNIIDRRVQELQDPNLSWELPESTTGPVRMSAPAASNSPIGLPGHPQLPVGPPSPVPQLENVINTLSEPRPNSSDPQTNLTTSNVFFEQPSSQPIPDGYRVLFSRVEHTLKIHKLRLGDYVRLQVTFADENSQSRTETLLSGIQVYAITRVPGIPVEEFPEEVMVALLMRPEDVNAYALANGRKGVSIAVEPLSAATNQYVSAKQELLDRLRSLPRLGDTGVPRRTGAVFQFHTDELGRFKWVRGIGGLSPRQNGEVVMTCAQDTVIRLQFSEIPNQPGLLANLDFQVTAQAIDAAAKSGPIPLPITPEDFAQLQSGRVICKVLYLRSDLVPKGENPLGILSETDPQESLKLGASASKRGQVLASLQLWNDAAGEPRYPLFAPRPQWQLPSQLTAHPNSIVLPHATSFNVSELKPFQLNGPEPTVELGIVTAAPDAEHLTISLKQFGAYPTGQRLIISQFNEIRPHTSYGAVEVTGAIDRETITARLVESSRVAVSNRYEWQLPKQGDRIMQPLDSSYPQTVPQAQTLRRMNPVGEVTKVNGTTVEGVLTVESSQVDEVLEVFRNRYDTERGPHALQVGAVKVTKVDGKNLICTVVKSRLGPGFDLDIQPGDRLARAVDERFTVPTDLIPVPEDATLPTASVTPPQTQSLAIPKGYRVVTISLVDPAPANLRMGDRVNVVQEQTVPGSVPGVATIVENVDVYAMNTHDQVTNVSLLVTPAQANDILHAQIAGQLQLVRHQPAAAPASIPSVQQTPFAPPVPMPEVMPPGGTLDQVGQEPPASIPVPVNPVERSDRTTNSPQELRDAILEQRDWVAEIQTMLDNWDLEQTPYNIPRRPDKAGWQKQLREAQQRLKIAEQEFRSHWEIAEQDVTLAESRLAAAQARLDRTSRLVQDGTIPQGEQQAAMLQLEEAQAASAKAIAILKVYSVAAEGLFDPPDETAPPRSMPEPQDNTSTPPWKDVPATTLPSTGTTEEFPTET